MKSVTIGFLGCGNIGCGVYKLLNGFTAEMAHRNGLSIEIKKILVRDITKNRGVKFPPGVLTVRPADILDDPEISMIAEFLGGEQPATEYMLRALSNGKTVITANKLALALNWHLLQAAAQEHGAGLYYEAAVCGAIPIVRVLTHSLQANRITKLVGIINGTTNYILSRMSTLGEEYSSALEDAQRLGLAEPDPSSDVEGMDSSYKLSILASLAFHTHIPVGKVFTEGITKITTMDIACGKELGFTLKLLAIAKRHDCTFELRVHPAFITDDHPIAAIEGAYNAVHITGHACQEMMMLGRGAGDMPTASSIVSDLLNAAEQTAHAHPTFRNTEQPVDGVCFSNNWECAFFVRLSAIDAPGVLCKVAGCFANEQVSIASMIQKDAEASGKVSLIFITHKAPEQAMHAALSQLDPEVCRLESMIRVEC